MYKLSYLQSFREYKISRKEINHMFYTKLAGRLQIFQGLISTYLFARKVMRASFNLKIFWQLGIPLIFPDVVFAILQLLEFLTFLP